MGEVKDVSGATRCIPLQHAMDFEQDIKTIYGACLPAVSHQPDWEHDLKKDLSWDVKVIGSDGLAKELCLFDPWVV